MRAYALFTNKTSGRIIPKDKVSIEHLEGLALLDKEYLL
jgi:hypothetical protein